MNNKSLIKLANQLSNAFLKNKIIKPLPLKITKKLKVANQFRKLCESKINEPIIGFKAGGTSIPLLKKLKSKKNLFMLLFIKKFLKNGKK